MTPAPWDEPATGPSEVVVCGVTIRAGARVRLRPRRRADILDIALDGKVATVETIEQDFEGNVHFAVTVDDDPGRDLGVARQIGHRFFFHVNEIEPLPDLAGGG